MVSIDTPAMTEKLRFSDQRPLPATWLKCRAVYQEDLLTTLSRVAVIAMMQMRLGGIHPDRASQGPFDLLTYIAR